jgi:hypothetical protein
MSQNNVIDYVRNAWGVLVVLRALDLRAHSPMYPQLTDGPDKRAIGSRLVKIRMVQVSSRFQLHSSSRFRLQFHSPHPEPSDIQYHLQ